MRYYKFKVINPNVSTDEVLKIEANTLDDAKKELSNRLNICKIFLSHIGTDEINYVSELERMFYDARIVNARNDINRICPYQTENNRFNVIIPSVEELLNHRISTSDTKHFWI